MADAAAIVRSTIAFFLVAGMSAATLAASPLDGPLRIQRAALVDESQAFFVTTTTGSDLNAGTMAAPYKTIGKGITSAAASGSKKRVLVSKGTYPESVVVTDGVSIYGGFDAAAGWSRAASNTTTITTASNPVQTYSVRVSGCSSVCYVDGFNIVAQGAGAGLNSIAVFLSSSPGARISHNVIVAGNGGSGVIGSLPPAAQAGANGNAGANASNDSFASVAAAQGGFSFCGASGGTGGIGGYDSSSGSSGSPGSGSGTGGAGGVGAFSNACNSSSIAAAGNGFPGSDGAPGGSGIGGSGGAVDAGGWLTATGLNGTAGTAGRGGGGGGGGGGGRTQIFACFFSDQGAGGGGGGAAGCGGAGGTGGGGGGASIGVLAFDSGGAIVVSNQVARGAGGSGAAGRNGAAGGARGLGGNGGARAGDGGAGGRGGDGGLGGSGGPGGGGAGGPSFGIHGIVFRANNVHSGGAVGTGGPGGTPSGIAGSAGQTADEVGGTAGGSYPVTVTVSGTGAVTSDIGWIDCGSACTSNLAIGTVVTLTAFPGSGQPFTGWSGDCTGTGACVVTMSSARNVTATFAAPGAVSPGSTTLDFGGQSMGTTSPAQSLVVTNTGGTTVSIGDVSSSDSAFAVSDDCATLAPGATCTIAVAFTPPANPATPLNGTVNHAGTLSIASNAPGSPHTVNLAGVGEKSLVTHYYRSILRRAPEAGAVPYWQGEAARVAGLGANVNETWYALAQTFYTSPEYVAFNRTPTAFVTDLYNTFFNRAPDTGGLNYWVGLIAQGMPREVVLVSFEISGEFTNFAKAIFGDTAARAEVDTVIDFYRGLLSRLPDSGGFQYWVGEFRAAQCQGPAAVYAKVEAISNAYMNSPEYTARNRNNAQFVGDVYNAFLRRGGDLGGVQYWIGQLDSGARTRQNIRQTFITTPEFSARVQAIINQGCLQ